MTAYAGFYVTPEAWEKWVRSHPECPTWEFGATFAEDLIETALQEKKMADYFFVEVVSVPPSEPDYSIGAEALMLVRQTAPKKSYISQQPSSKCDVAGQQILKQLIGLEVSGWVTMWYNEESYEPPHEAKFLKPRAQAQSHTKANSETESGVHSEIEQGGDQEATTSDAEVDDGWVVLDSLSLHST